MLRRVHIENLRAGELELPQSQAHHLRDVLRLEPDEEVELFDTAGRTARALIISMSANSVKVRVDAANATAPR